MPPLFSVPGVVQGRFLGLLCVVALFLSVIYYMRRKKSLYIRKVAGLDAIEDAVGRATEMRKPAVCSFGIGGFGYSTVFGLAILSYVAELSAKMGTRLIVPTGGGTASMVVRPVAQDIVRQAYIAAGREDMYKDEDIPFFSGQQYAYIGGYVGVLQRTRPAVVVMVGSHASETLNITETSNAVGAIVISSATSVSYAAFLTCSSDYCLIGEEGPAAGAYLSQDPSQRASIGSQDLFKWVALILIVVGLAAYNVGSDVIIRLLQS